MKILFLIPTLVQGGAESLVIKLAFKLSEVKNTEIYIYVLKKDTSLLPKNIPHNVVIKTFGLKKSLRSFFNFLSFIKDVKKLNPDVIHSHMFYSNMLARFFKNSTNRIVNHYHGLSSWFNLFHKIAEKMTKKNMDYCIVTSKASYKIRLNREKIPKDRLKLIYNSVSIPFHYKDSHTKKRKFVFGMACRLIPLKNIKLAIDCIDSLNQINDIYSLKIAGSGPEEKNIKDYIAQKDIHDKVELLGFLEDVDNFYRNIDGLLITSDTEDFPMTAIEAMSYNLPIISKDLGDISILINEGYGLVFDENNGSFQQEINNFIIKYKVNSGTKNRDAVIKNYSIDSYVKKIISIYEK